MFRKSIFCALLLALILPSEAMPTSKLFKFGTGSNRREWKWQYGQDPVYKVVSGDTAWIRFDGFEAWSSRWYKDSNTWVDSTADSMLHLRFEKVLNFYFYDSLGADCPHRDSMRTIRDTLFDWRAYFSSQSHYNWWDSTKCARMLLAMQDTFIWTCANIGSVETFRYGKYSWDIHGDFGYFNGFLHPGVWIWDDDTTNWRQANNEVDFEWGHDTTIVISPNPYQEQVLPVAGKLGYGVQPWTGPDTTPWTPYPERQLLINAHNDTSWHEMTYKPESVKMYSHWTADTNSWTFPNSLPGIPRRGYEKNVGWGGLGTSPRTGDSIVVAQMGNHTRARISFLHKFSPDSTGVPGSPYQTDIIIRSFRWTGIPDLSFVDSVGTPWPWQTGPWHPYGWGSSVVVVTDTTTRTTIYSYRHEQQAYVYWGVHNVGTAATPTGYSLRSVVYYDNYDQNSESYIPSGIGPDTIAFSLAGTLNIGGIYTASLPLRTLSVGKHQIRVAVDPLGSFEELRTSNNADTVTVEVIATDLSFYNYWRQGLISIDAQSLKKGCSELFLESKLSRLLI